MNMPDISNRYRMMAEINVIPLIDVALVLLLIFMIVTPFLVKSQIKINLPESAATDGKLSKTDNIEVQVREDGAIFVAGSLVKPGDVEAELKRLLPSPGTQPVVVEADRNVAFRHVVTVLDAAKRIGATRLGVCVKEESNRGRRGGGARGSE